MQSNDLVIRTERNLLRREFEDFKATTQNEFKNVRQEMATEFKNVRQEMATEFKNMRQEMATEFKNMRQEMQSEFKLVRQELDGLNRTIDTMISIFGWGFALVAIAVAIAPMLRELFIYRQEKHSDEELERKIRKILSEMKDS